MTLCRAVTRLGFVTSLQWAPLTHAVPPPREVMHQAAHPDLSARSRDRTILFMRAGAAVAAAAGRRTGAGSVSSRAHREPRRDRHAAGVWLFRARRRIQNARAPNGGRSSGMPSCSLSRMHCHSNVCPSSASTSALMRALPVFMCRRRAHLSAAIACMRAFVSTDTGPMHLASSTDVPTVALFRASDPLQYGPLKAERPVDRCRATVPRTLRRICQRVWRGGARRDHDMRVRLIGKANGVGLSRDLELLGAALQSPGCEVTQQPCDRRERRRRRCWLTRMHARGCAGAKRAAARFDVNVMLEHVWPQFLHQARCNVLVPNPEWFDRRDAALLSSHRSRLGQDRADPTAVSRRAAARTVRSVSTAKIGWRPTSRASRTSCTWRGRSELKGTQRLLRAVAASIRNGRR